MDMKITYDTPLLTALGQLAPHDHLSSIFESPEDRFSVAIPFIRIGLDRGEKCLYVADDGNEAAVQKAMHVQGIDVERAIESKSLMLETTKSVYLKRGFFDLDWMTTFWVDTAAEASRQGFPTLRAVAETEWLARTHAGVDRWTEYESRMTQVLARLNSSVLCQYNRQILPAEVILNVIRTHPTVIYRGVVCRNMYYVPPDEFMATNQAAHEVERLLATLRERAEVEQTLRQQRDELRSLANRLMHAQDDERRRLATMLHETTAQDLAALKMLLTRLNREAGGLGHSERHDLAESISLTEQSIAGIRTVSYLLHPPLLDEAGLLTALRWYAGGFAERSGIKVDLDLPENLERLPLDTETVLFRVVQESLTNIHQHAESETARIQLRRDAEMIALAIEDRGNGIPSETLEQITSGGVGVGVAGMSERIEQLGGRLEVTSSDRGTRVRVWVPVEKEAN